MKRFLLLFAIIATMNCAGQSRISSDTICITRVQAEKVLIAAQQKRILDEQVDILNQRIGEKEAIIAGLKEKDLVNTSVLATYQEEIRVMKDQRGLFEGEVKTLTRALKKQRRKTFWTAMAGAVTTTAAIFLFK